MMVDEKQDIMAQQQQLIYRAIGVGAFFCCRLVRFLKSCEYFPKKKKLGKQNHGHDLIQLDILLHYLAEN